MAVTEWHTLVQQCLLNRVLPAAFLSQVRAKSSIQPKLVVEALLNAKANFCVERDPLPSRYLEQLLTSHSSSLSDLLVVLILRWNRLRSTEEKTHGVDVFGLTEASAFLINSKLVLSNTETRKCLVLCSRWLLVIVKSINGASDAPTAGLAEALSNLLSTIAGTAPGVDLLSTRKDKIDDGDVTEAVAQAVKAAIGLFPTLSVQTTDRLGVIQKHISLLGNASHAQVNTELEAMQFQASVAEIPMTASREATTMYLELMFCESRTIDDNIVFNFLAGRHNNNFEAMFEDVVLASFDILRRTLEGIHGQQCEVFIRNKLPALLAMISVSSFGSFSVEQTLRTLWSQLPDSWTAQRFLHVCSLNQVLSPETGRQLIGNQELISSLPESLLSKEDLIAQVNSNQARTVRLVEELLQADGSAAAIAQALVEIIMAYCASKETHHLKDLANTMLRKPTTIDVLAMFIRPTYWLSPLCTLLEEWRWDDIHGESQPLYDEFGGIFLLILASKRRLSLSISDIGVENGFIARYLDQEGCPRAVNDLSEESQKHLADWINALPQEFYLLVPTLLQQSVNAQRKGRLTNDALKGGLEYLHEPFLLPSLVSAMVWLLHTDQEMIGQLTPIFTKPPSSEIEIHRTILDITKRKESKSHATLDLMKPSSATFAAVQASLHSHGPEFVVHQLVRSLAKDMSVNLDIAATLVCCSDRSLRDVLRLKCADLGGLIKKDRGLAEALVHLHRRVEAYASVLVVQVMDMQFAPLQLNSAEADMEVMPDQEAEQPMDDIDQVLNEQAAIGSLEQDPGMSMEDLYGLPSDNMGLGNLDDLDLDMF